MGFWKYNVHVAVRSSHSVVAVVVHDFEGSLCMAYTEHIHSQDPLFRETATLWATVRLVENEPWPLVIFESDCLSLIRDVHGSNLLVGRQVETWMAEI